MVSHEMAPYTIPKLDPTSYEITPAPTGWSIKSRARGQYIWLSGEWPYITGHR